MRNISGAQTRRGRPKHGRLYSIASSSPFLETLVDRLIDGTLIDGFLPGEDPLALSRATIFVPSRRSARALAASFLDRMKEQKSVLLPKIRTLGDVSDEEFGFAPESDEYDQIPEAIGALPRKLELAYLIRHWVDTMESRTREIYGDEDIVIPSSSADALRLADDLAVLMTQINQEEISWEAIDAIVPEQHADWWQLTSEFLKIVTQIWPQRLSEIGLVDPAFRSTELLRLRAKRYEVHGSKGPVIIAGTTGSVPSTQLLLKAVSQLPQGAVILPGLDFSMPSSDWHALTNAEPTDNPALETHPQFGLARLLRSLNAERQDVQELFPSHDKIDDRLSTRRSIVGLALADAEATSRWIDQADGFEPTEMQAALCGISLIEAGNERSEALAIAVALREALETPEKTAALVTPDRNLARRVSAELLRFGIVVDDSGGIPLANSDAAIFLKLVTDCVFSTPRNTSLAALIKHHFCRAGRSEHEALALGQAMEIAGLRGAISPARPGSLANDLARRQQELGEASHIPQSVRRLDEKTWQQLIEHCSSLDRIWSPLLSMRSDEIDWSIAELAKTLRAVLLELSSNAEGTSKLFEGEGGEALLKLLEGLIEAGEGAFRVRWQDFPSVISALVAGINTRPRYNRHPRLHIFGPLEIRLIDHDCVILGGLNEGTWPSSVRNDPFLNRSMRHELGMASPERRVGLAAHDFQQLMGKREVILSRASRVDKAPTIASRWLQRLEALVGKDQHAALVHRGQTYLHYAELLDLAADKPERIHAPAPQPPVSARPTSLPVTAIETWIRDPYALYANRILRLEPIPPLEREPDALLKGTLYHRIMQDYVESNPQQRSSAERAELLFAIAEETIREENLPEEISRTWLFRFREVAEPYLAWEAVHHAEQGVRETYCEIPGKVPLFDGAFELTARADRIDVSISGDAFLMDYKTGTNPSPAQARTLSPQLALEGLILQKGGFETVPSRGIADLLHIRLRSGGDFKSETITNKDNAADTIVTHAGASLEDLFRAFQQPEKPYISRRIPFREGDMSGDYDHLARTREWAIGGGGDGDD